MGFEIKRTTVRKSTVKKAAAKEGAGEKSAAKKSAAKKSPAAEASAGKSVKRVPPRIVKKVSAPTKQQEKQVYDPDSAAQAVAMASSIAEEMKRAARRVDSAREAVEIHLTRRPTTRAHGENTVRFPDADLAEFRKRLIDVREKTRGGVAAIRETGFSEFEDHEADGGDGTNQTLRLQALGQVGNINRTLQQIEEALHRIEDGTYGVCTVCGQLIRKPRLMNRPFVLTCMECQSEMERNGRT